MVPSSSMPLLYRACRPHRNPSSSSSGYYLDWLATSVVDPQIFGTYSSWIHCRSTIFLVEDWDICYATYKLLWALLGSHLRHVYLAHTHTHTHTHTRCIVSIRMRWVLAMATVTDRSPALLSLSSDMSSERFLQPVSLMTLHSRNTQFHTVIAKVKIFPQYFRYKCSFNCLTHSTNDIQSEDQSSISQRFYSASDKASTEVCNVKK